MRQHELTLEMCDELFKRIMTYEEIKQVVGEDYQILYDYNDPESVLGYLFFYIQPGIVLFPITDIDGIHLYFRTPRMMEEKDILFFEKMLKKYQAKNEHLTKILQGVAPYDNYTWEELNSHLIQNNIETESEFSADFKNFIIYYVPGEKPKGYIVISLKNQSAYLPFYKSYAFDHFEQFNPYDLQIFTKEDHDIIQNYQKKCLENVDFVLKKQRLRTLFHQKGAERK